MSYFPTASFSLSFLFFSLSNLLKAALSSYVNSAFNEGRDKSIMSIIMNNNISGPPGMGGV